MNKNKEPKRPYNPDQFLVLDILQYIQQLEVAETDTIANNIPKYSPNTLKKALTSMKREGYIKIFHKGSKVKLEQFAWSLDDRGIEKINELEEIKKTLNRAKVEALTHGWLEGHTELSFCFRYLQPGLLDTPSSYNHFAIKENSIIYLYNDEEEKWMECRTKKDLSTYEEMSVVEIIEMIVEDEKGRKKKQKVDSNIPIYIRVNEKIKVHRDSLELIGTRNALERYLKKQKKEEPAPTPEPAPPTPPITPQKETTKKETPKPKIIKDDDFPSAEAWKQFIDEDEY